MKFVKNNIYIISVLLLLFFTFSIFYRSDDSFDQDLGRHLKLGEIITKNLEVPQTNLFSYTNPDFQFINHHFLFEVFIYNFNNIFGIYPLLIIKVFIILISVFLILQIVGKKFAPLLLPLGYIFLHVLRERTDLRPEIFSFLFTTLIYYILNKFLNSKTRLIYVLPIIQFLWVNIHIYFILGIILQTLYLFIFYLNKDWKKFKTLAFVFGISIVAVLFNPNFINGALYPLKVFQNYGYTIAENQSLFLLESIGFNDPNFLFVKIIVCISLISILFSVIRNSFSLLNTSLIILAVLLSLVHIRSFPYLFFLCLPPVIFNFNLLKINKFSSVFFILSVVLLIWESSFYFSGDYYKLTDSRTRGALVLGENVKPAMDFVLKNKLPQPIYNNFDIGSYIIYRGYPEYKVFVDGRPEAYPADFFEKIYIPSQSDPKLFKELDDKYNFQTVIFSITDQTPWGKNFLYSILKNKDWKTVFLDHFMIVLVKENVVNGLALKEINLNELSINNYNYTNYLNYAQMSYFLIVNEATPTAKIFTEKALLINPQSKIANTLYQYLSGSIYKGDNANVWW